MKVEQEPVEQEPVGDTKMPLMPLAIMPPPTRKSKHRHIPKDFGPEYMVGDEMDQGIEDDEVHFAHSAAMSPEPKTFEEAARSPDSGKWLEAMDSELKSFEK